MTETMSTTSEKPAAKFPEPLSFASDPATSGATYDIRAQFMLASLEEQHEIEQFYYYEAALLDEHKFSTWVEMFTEDCLYFMPVRQTRLTGQLEEEFSKPGEMAFFEDDKELLRFRARKLESEYAWGENPPSRSRHLFTNIRVAGRVGDTLETHSNFVFYRGSYERQSDWWVGRREDKLRRENGCLRIAKRSIFLEHTVILSRNMSHLF